MKKKGKTYKVKLKAEEIARIESIITNAMEIRETIERANKVTPRELMAHSVILELVLLVRKIKEKD